MPSVWTLVAWTQNANCYIWCRRQKRRCHVLFSSPAPESDSVGNTDISLKKKNIYNRTRDDIMFLLIEENFRYFVFWSLFLLDIRNSSATTKINFINFVRILILHEVKENRSTQRWFCVRSISLVPFSEMSALESWNRLSLKSIRCSSKDVLELFNVKLKLKIKNLCWNNFILDCLTLHHFNPNRTFDFSL